MSGSLPQRMRSRRETSACRAHLALVDERRGGRGAKRRSSIVMMLRVVTLVPSIIAARVVARPVRHHRDEPARAAGEGRLARAEACEPRHAEGEVDFVMGGEVEALLVVEQLAAHVAQLLRRRRRILERVQDAVDADHRRGAGLQMQIAGTRRDHLLQHATDVHRVTPLAPDRARGAYDRAAPAVLSVRRAGTANGERLTSRPGRASGRIRPAGCSPPGS
jgi:hypothetical protein